MQLQTSIPTKKGIDFIINSKKPYPDWIKTHQVFKELPKLDKIFPRIGLSNFKESCEIINTQEAIAAATKLGQKIVSEITIVIQGLQFDLRAALRSSATDRDTLCGNLTTIISLYHNLQFYLSFTSGNTSDYIFTIDGRVDLKLPQDLFVPSTKGFKILFKNGQGIFSILTQLKEKYPTRFVNVDQLAEFKLFSSVNVGKKKYNVVFSSSEEDGAWDIATASMRGIESCQGWSKPQSRGLIGSISSRYCGIIYLESSEKIEPYGSKMLYRSMVRFCFNSQTKKPAIIIDRMYPSENEATILAFKSALNKRSGIDVIFATRAVNEMHNWYIPTDDDTAVFLKAGETSYMDSKISVIPHKVNKLKVAQLEDWAKPSKALVDKIYKNLQDLEKTNRTALVKANEELGVLRAKFETEKHKWENENKDLPEDKRTVFELKEPKLDKDLHNFFKHGENNMFAHCDKHYGAYSAGRCFAKLILDKIPQPDVGQCNSSDEFYKKYLISIIQNFAKLKAGGKTEMKACSWYKSFPKSSDQFYELVSTKIKEQAILSIKELFKVSN